MIVAAAPHVATATASHPQRPRMVLDMALSSPTARWPATELVPALRVTPYPPEREPGQYESDDEPDPQRDRHLAGGPRLTHLQLTEAVGQEGGPHPLRQPLEREDR